MRIPKRLFSFSLSNFSPQLISPLLSSRISFAFGISAKPSRLFPNIASPGASQLHSQSSMDENHDVGIHDSRSVDLPDSDSGKQPRVWSSSPEHGSKTDRGKQIFCNRSLNMKNIVAVGFDMDYTLAQYKPETFESLAYQGTIKKLVYDLGYPSELLNWSFNWKYMVRGLVLDKKRGNILKMDRHKYVKVAYHGFRELSKEDKVGTYGNTLVRDSFDEPDYALIDTLFSLAEAYLFAQLVDFKDSNPEKIREGVDYARMYKDVRAAVDLCHRDGTLKQMVAKDPGRYINEDNLIVPMLEMLRESGRATFLVTNSAKPGFFHEENRANLFEVVPETGMLLNTDNGSPMPQVGNISARIFTEATNHACQVFQGGNVAHLHKLLSIESSSQVLYVGDHIYGDILRSKKVLGWRTMLVIPELEKEVKLLWESRDTRKEDFYLNILMQELQFLRSERDRIEDEVHHLKWSLKFKNPDAKAKQKLSSALDKLELEREKMRLIHQEAQRKLHQRFHEPWGQLMKTGYQNSRFAHQVERFACLYTSQVSNLALHSPDKYYRPSEDFMQHEFGILASEPREM
ncbi:cytosolic purine 5'-nucleotidase isoform X3 [Medicago truncatula]|uniref:cytosolic purine 5'-nucleotidase isoform X3 n=1 Tax=Medicago truncatula TaxID=3880 RepID=UPI000D2F253E|nr:cytosolic purine 5'-nucleotidase isoform X3 [Medicago truncatula]